MNPGVDTNYFIPVEKSEKKPRSLEWHDKKVIPLMSESCRKKRSPISNKIFKPKFVDIFQIFYMR